jgi:hypothetical protein
MFEMFAAGLTNSSVIEHRRSKYHFLFFARTNWYDWTMQKCVCLLPIGTGRLARQSFIFVNSEKIPGRQLLFCRV